MRFILPLLLIVLVAAVADSGPPVAGGNNNIDVQSPNGPIVVELFTSEGCSSCPPADRLFSQLEGDVVQLGFHVDYWNHLGWRDPFSDARWSDRQRRYSDAFERGYVYTPQLVVNGRAEAVGSDRREVQAMLREAATKKPSATLELAVEPGAGELAVAVAGRLVAGSEPAALLVAVTESGFEIDVEAGENRNRKLRHQHVVRDLHELGRLQPGAPLEQTVVLPLDAGWKREHVSIVAFAQDPVTLEIHGAAVWRAGG